jgi:hypothetical protein
MESFTILVNTKQTRPARLLSQDQVDVEYSRIRDAWWIPKQVCLRAARIHLTITPPLAIICSLAASYKMWRVALSHGLINICGGYKQYKTTGYQKIYQGEGLGKSDSVLWDCGYVGLAGWHFILRFLSLEKRILIAAPQVTLLGEEAWKYKARTVISTENLNGL